MSQSAVSMWIRAVCLGEAKDPPVKGEGDTANCNACYPGLKTHAHTHTHTHMHGHIHARTHTCTRTRIHMHAGMHTRTHMQMHARILDI